VVWLTLKVDSFTFGMLLEVQGRPPLTNQVTLSPNCIFGFGNHSEANLITATEKLEMVFFIVKKSLFWKFANQMGRYDLDDTFMARNVVVLDPIKLIPYKKYLKDIYEAVSVSRRSLIYGFKDIFGIGPMSYLKIQRLNGVRRAFFLADPKINRVKKIAYAWGFWHLGHFSRDYKKMFGQTPSETLKNPRSKPTCFNPSLQSSFYDLLSH
jgi:AraC-like DNA-binding protein